MTPLGVALLRIFIVLLGVGVGTVTTSAKASEIIQQQQIGFAESAPVVKQEKVFWGALEAGPELVNNRLGLRLAGHGSWYASSGLFGIRLDAGLVQNELQDDMTKLLLSTGFKLDKSNQLVFSTGWLQRYAWDNLNNLSAIKAYTDALGKEFFNLGKHGFDQNQYTLGAEYKREILPLGTGLTPGISVSLSNVYSHSKGRAFPWKLFKENPPNKKGHFWTDYWAFALGGGSRLETLAGVKLDWQAFELGLQSGLRHRDWDFFGYLQGYAYDYEKSNAPMVVVQLTWRELLGYKLSPYYSWEPDLQVVGSVIQRNITPHLSLVARTELMQGRGLPDDTRYFCGLVYSFGPEPKSFPKGDWLTPVYGTSNEYLAPHLRQLRMKAWSEGSPPI